jgi:hypothetical protein
MLVLLATPRVPSFPENMVMENFPKAENMKKVKIFRFQKIFRKIATEHS